MKPTKEFLKRIDGANLGLQELEKKFGVRLAAVLEQSEFGEGIKPVVKWFDKQ